MTAPYEESPPLPSTPRPDTGRTATTAMESTSPPHPLRSTDDVKILEARVRILENIVRDFYWALRQVENGGSGGSPYMKYKDFFDGKY